VLLDLSRELAGGGDDERTRAAALPRDEALEDREREGRGLSAARLRQAEDVAAGERGWNRRDLNRAGLAETRCCDRTLERRC
jgi:hypothetical protein